MVGRPFKEIGNPIESISSPTKKPYYSVIAYDYQRSTWEICTSLYTRVVVYVRTCMSGKNVQRNPFNLVSICTQFVVNNRGSLDSIEGSLKDERKKEKRQMDSWMNSERAWKRDGCSQHLFDINETSIQPLNDQLAQFRPSYFSVNERRSVLLSLATYGATTSPSTP